eukprot:g38556.t1
MGVGKFVVDFGGQPIPRNGNKDVKERKGGVKDGPAHTKSSLLRSLSNGVKINENLVDEWLLPENKELFVNNHNKELKVLK